MEKDQQYDGPERRQYCAMHCVIADQTKRSVPQWAFIASLSSMIAVAGIFGGWHLTSMNSFKVDIEARLVKMEIHLESRFNELKFQYTRDIERFYKAAERNGVMLNELDRKVEVIQTKQDMVLEKIKLTE